MESYYLLISAYLLFSASFMFAHARDYGHASSSPDEYYWQTIWPNTPIPSSLQVLLKQDPTEINDLFPMEIDDTQYPTTIFPQRDLYPGQKMNLQFTNIPYAGTVNLVFLYVVNEIKDEHTFKEMCINRSVKGEERFCAKSLGTIIDFVTSKLGKDVQMLSSSFVNNQEQYTVEGVHNLGTKAVMCHRRNFSKPVFFCHEITHTTLFMIPMVANDGTKTHALAVCHTHILGVDDALIHQAIKLNPKNNPFCHFTEDKAVAWVPNLAMDNAYGNNFAV